MREGRWNEVDRENVAEEIESLGREQFNKLESALRVLTTHMLKRDHQADRRSRCWGVSIATQRIEDLMRELVADYTIVIVTHNMQQAARVADRTAFFSLEVQESQRYGVLVEYGDTEKVFTAPADQRTEDYVTGRFG